jgi:polyisoprenoid-binding protein YceI
MNARTTAISATRWRIDPARSQVAFEVPQGWGLPSVKGHFGEFKGSVDLSSAPAVELTVEAASVETKIKQRDRHLRSPVFFDVANHPRIRFLSEEATLDGDRLTVRGRLHAAGESVLLDINATLRHRGDELFLEASTEVDQRQLGMTYSPLGMVRTPTTLTVSCWLVPAVR